MKNRQVSEHVNDNVPMVSISHRLRELIGSRSVRAAAKDWELSFSTLNNYLTRGTEPSLNVAIKISNVEHVSVEWLATGKKPSTKVEFSTCVESSDPMEYIWKMIYDSLDSNDRDLFIKLIHKQGIKGILSMQNQLHNLAYHTDLNNSLLDSQMKQIIEILFSCDEKQIEEILRSAINIKRASPLNEHNTN